MPWMTTNHIWVQIMRYFSKHCILENGSAEIEFEGGDVPNITRINESATHWFENKSGIKCIVYLLSLSLTMWTSSLCKHRWCLRAYILNLNILDFNEIDFVKVYKKKYYEWAQIVFYFLWNNFFTNETINVRFLCPKKNIGK